MELVFHPPRLIGIYYNSQNATLSLSALTLNLPVWVPFFFSARILRILTSANQYKQKGWRRDPEACPAHRHSGTCSFRGGGADPVDRTQNCERCGIPGDDTKAMPLALLHYVLFIVQCFVIFLAPVCVRDPCDRAGEVRMFTLVTRL